MHKRFRVMCACVLVVVFAPTGDAAAQTRQAGTPPVATTSASIEPDEIDVAQTQRKTPPSRASATPKPATGAAATLAAGAGGNGGQKYETAECGTKEKPITCCTKGDGPGASCNLFILLCNEGGGAGKGDSGDAICVH